MTTIQELLKTPKKLIIGTDQTVKHIRIGKLTEILIAKDYQESRLKIIKHLADTAGIKINTLKQSAEELGALCRKPFSIHIIGVRK